MATVAAVTAATASVGNFMVVGFCRLASLECSFGKSVTNRYLCDVRYLQVFCMTNIWKHDQRVSKQPRQFRTHSTPKRT